MYLDQLPDLSRARLVRTRARGVAIRDGERAAAIAFVADGSLVDAGTLVRFDVTRGEDAGRRLGEAFTATATNGIWFYGGDEITRDAVAALDLALRPVGAVFVHRMDPAHTPPVVFRAPAQRDRPGLVDLQHEHAPGFRAALVEIVEVHGEAVGVVMTEPLDATWSEVRIVVYPPHRGRGYGAALLANAADRIESTGRRVCAAIETPAGRERGALEQAGFRLADYYFVAVRRD